MAVPRFRAAKIIFMQKSCPSIGQPCFILFESINLSRPIDRTEKLIYTIN